MYLFRIIFIQFHRPNSRVTKFVILQSSTYTVSFAEILVIACIFGSDLKFNFLSKCSFKLILNNTFFLICRTYDCIIKHHIKVSCCFLLGDLKLNTYSINVKKYIFQILRQYINFKYNQ